MYDIVARYCRHMNRSTTLFHPSPGSGVNFLASGARIQLPSGSNRGGKTIHAAFKVVLTLLGLGEKWGMPARDGRMIAIGQDWDHVAEVMWRKMAWPGQFKIIRDLKTGLWRSLELDPTDPTRLSAADMLRMMEWKGAPPFLAIDEIEVTWEKRNRDMPRRIRVPSTGWECLFDSSEGEPIQGVDFNLCWLDEEIRQERWVSEMLMRLVDRNGQMWWSYTPQASTPQAFDFHRQAEAGAPHIKEFPFYIYENPYLPEQAKREIYDSLRPEEREVRWFGKYAIQSRRVYPEFEPFYKHKFSTFTTTPAVGAPSVEQDECPTDWMRVFSVDPGFQTCAVLMGAIPPQGHRLHPKLHIYDEIYLHSASCTSYGEALLAKTRGSEWEAAIIDHRFGRQSQPTSGRPLVDHYVDEHRERGIRTRMSDEGFIWGSDKVEGRTDALHALLEQDLLVVHPRCHNFIREMQDEYFLKDSPDKRNSRKYGHLVACMEMMAAYFDSCGGLYHSPPSPVATKPQISDAVRAFRKKQARAKREKAFFGGK